MITLGCDVGSIFSKAVLMKDGEILSKKVTGTTGEMEKDIGELVNSMLSDTGISQNEIDSCVSTGQGKDRVPMSSKKEDETQCIARAASSLTPDARFIINIGGQSVRSILLGGDGEIIDFATNDKCAAGSGRFLEIAAKALELDVGGVDKAAGEAKKPVDISSQCAVFAESEVITHVNEGKSVADIMAGVCKGVAKTITSQARGIGTGEAFTITGGVGKINCMVQLICKNLGWDFVEFPEDPQFAGAIGAALLGGEKA